MSKSCKTCKHCSLEDEYSYFSDIDFYACICQRHTKQELEEFKNCPGGWEPLPFLRYLWLPTFFSRKLNIDPILTPFFSYLIYSILAVTIIAITCL